MSLAGFTRECDCDHKSSIGGKGPKSEVRVAFAVWTCRRELEFEHGCHGPSAVVAAQLEPQPLGQDLHSSVVEHHLGRNATQLFIPRHSDEAAEQLVAQPEILI